MYTRVEKNKMKEKVEEWNRDMSIRFPLFIGGMPVFFFLLHGKSVALPGPCESACLVLMFLAMFIRQGTLMHCGVWGVLLVLLLAVGVVADNSTSAEGSDVGSAKSMSLIGVLALGVSLGIVLYACLVTLFFFFATRKYPKG